MLLNACKDIGLAVNIGKVRHMEVGCHLGLIADEQIMEGINSCEKVKTFKCLGHLLLNQNSIHEKIKF